ncbi:MAG TPA: hypothetical protein VF572_06010 [Candidatus Saccharimonadales bacterium]|jgi:hypothetical protein
MNERFGSVHDRVLSVRNNLVGLIAMETPLLTGQMVNRFSPEPHESIPAAFDVTDDLHFVAPVGYVGYQVGKLASEVYVARQDARGNTPTVRRTRAVAVAAALTVGLAADYLSQYQLGSSGIHHEDVTSLVNDALIISVPVVGAMLPKYETPGNTQTANA